MNSFQVVAIVALAVLAAVTVMAHARRWISRGACFLWCSVWAAAAVACIWPNITSVVARGLGIGRGADLRDLKRVTNQNAREELNYHTVFNQNDGWATTDLKRGRSDFIFLIDHGWQTKVKEERIGGGGSFFNLVADPRDFKEYANLEPKERLRKFNEEIKALGWNHRQRPPGAGGLHERVKEREHG